jgi:hypothetical protein
LSGSRLDKFRYDGKGNYSIDQDTFNKVMEIESEEERLAREKKEKKIVKSTGINKELQTVFRGFEMDAQKIADGRWEFSLKD